MREIKFKVYLWGHCISDEEEFYLETNGKLIEARKGWECDDDYKVLFYTGLKDVNGTEIYEGDILKDKYKDEYYLVKYKDGGFSALLNFDTERRVFDIDLFEVCGKYTDVEVISNTYEEKKRGKENE